jgi:hypothetical protein
MKWILTYGQFHWRYFWSLIIFRHRNDHTQFISVIFVYRDLLLINDFFWSLCFVQIKEIFIYLVLTNVTDNEKCFLILPWISNNYILICQFG